MLTEARGLKFSDTMQYALYLSIPSNIIESPKYLLKEFIPLKGKIQIVVESWERRFALRFWWSDPKWPHELNEMD